MLNDDEDRHTNGSMTSHSDDDLGRSLFIANRFVWRQCVEFLHLTAK